MVLIKIGKNFEVEFALHGMQFLYLRMGRFERFYNRMGFLSH